MKTSSVSGFLPLEARSIGIHGFCWQELKFDIVVGLLHEWALNKASFFLYSKLLSAIVSISVSM